MASTASEGLQPPRKRTKRDFTDTITILVGNEEKVFTAHENIITEASDFFRAACRGGWRESRDKLVRLPEVDSDEFEVYLAWLYTGEVDITVRVQDEDEAFNSSADLLVQCFALGDMLQDVRFKNSVNDKFIRHLEDEDAMFSPDTITRLCRVVREDSTLTRLCVDYAAFDMYRTTFDEDVEKYPHKFVLMIAKASAGDCYCDQSKEGKRPVNRKPCFYHEHPEGKGSTETCSNAIPEQSKGT